MKRKRMKPFRGYMSVDKHGNAFGFVEPTQETVKLNEHPFRVAVVEVREVTHRRPTRGK